MRSEEQVFKELSALCKRPGYVHALAMLSIRDNIVPYEEELKASDLAPMYSWDRLIRTEVATLHGLMIQGDVDYVDCSPPSFEQLKDYVEQSEKLLGELHDVITPPMFEGGRMPRDVLSRGESLREAIFYAGESAYDFQFRDLAGKKYSADDQWIRANRHFSIEHAQTVVRALSRVATERLKNTLEALAQPVSSSECKYVMVFSGRG